MSIPLYRLVGTACIILFVSPHLQKSTLYTLCQLRLELEKKLKEKKKGRKKKEFSKLKNLRM